MLFANRTTSHILPPWIKPSSELRIVFLRCVMSSRSLAKVPLIPDTDRWNLHQLSGCVGAQASEIHVYVYIYI